MVLPQRIGPTLGAELQTLAPHQGQRLKQILWRLAGEVSRQPADFYTAIAYGYALQKAGRAADARLEALRALQIAETMGDAAPTAVLLNIASALTDTGLPAPATDWVERTLASNPKTDDEATGLSETAVGIAVRYGELEWHAQRFPRESCLRFIEERGLSSWWAAQQRAIETTLGARIASVGCSILEDPEEETQRLSLDYYTDAQSHEEIGELQNAVLDAVAAVYAKHPDGPGAFLGHVLIDIHGAEIPLAELAP